MVDIVSPASIGADPAGDRHAPHKGLAFILLYAVAMTGAWTAILTPIIVTLPLRVRALLPGSEGASLSLVLGVGAILAMIGNPLFGKLSDQTTSRWGMRRPWMVGGAIGGVAGIAIVALAPGLALLLVGWCIVQLSLNATLGSLTAVLADQVPPDQRGLVSGVLGTCLPIGQILGTFLVQLVSGSLLTMMLLPAIAGTVMVLVFACYFEDRRLDRRAVPQESTGRWLRDFWINPADAPDFAWTWLSRFSLLLGLAFVLTYQALFLLNHLHVSTEALPRLLFISSAAASIGLAIASLIAGKLSDLLRRRKVFIFLSALTYAIGLWIIAASTEFPLFLVGITVAGISQGVYYGVDLALITEVMPARETDAAKNLGIFNIASALPQSIAPAIAPAILAVGSGNYAWLFLVAGAFAMFGAAAIMPVKSVR